MDWNWNLMTADEAEALASGLYAGEQQYELNWNGAVAGAGGFDYPTEEADNAELTA